MMTYRSMIKRRLAKSVHMIEAGQRLIDEQRLRMERSKQQGLMLSADEAALRRLETAQAAYVSTRDRLHAALQTSHQSPLLDDRAGSAGESPLAARQY